MEILNEEEYNWQRFWCPYNSTVHFDGGFLYDPTSEWGHIYNPNAKPMAEYAQYRCLILLGEPGMGKSFEVSKNLPTTNDLEKPDNMQYITENLRSYDSIDRLEKKIFESGEFLSWQKSDKILCLTLESFDECLIKVDTLNIFLIEQILSLPTERLFLRIVCRTGYWPNVLETGLRKAFKDNINIIELMPLRHSDVVCAAEQIKIDVQSFLQAVYSLEITPFAARPVTLKLLLKQFAKNSKLASDQVQIYQDGCLSLCEEVNPGRVDTRTAGVLSSKEKLIIAARMAATLNFSGKTSLWTDFNNESLDSAMMITDIFGSEQVDGVKLRIDRKEVRETLATGLFSARGSCEMGFSHQTYGEFLAAYYIKYHSTSIEKVKDLIFHPDGKIIPCYYSIAAWIAVMDVKVFDLILQAEPEILLLGDIAATTDSQKEKLTAIYLANIEEKADLDWDLRKRIRHDRLKYSHIADQLKPYIIDKTKRECVRREALMIVKECMVQELCAECLGVALDLGESMEIRSMAARALVSIGEERDKAQLKQLLAGDEQDSVDQLKGYVLQAIWPKYLSAKELFDILTPAKKQNFVGSYSYFIDEYLIPGMRQEDIPIALEWVYGQLVQDSSIYRKFNTLIDDILLYAWGKIDYPDVLEPFARVVLHKIQKSQRIIEGYSHTDNSLFMRLTEQAKRYALIEKLVMLMENDDAHWYQLKFCCPPIVEVADFEWILKKIHSQPEMPAGQQKIWIRLLRNLWVSDLSNIGLTTEIYHLTKISSVANDICSGLFEPQLLSSESAKIEKECYYAELRKKQSKESDENRINLTIELEKIFSNIDSDYFTFWWKCLQWLKIEDDGITQKHERVSDIRALPGWPRLNPAEKEKIIEVAYNYLTTQQPLTKMLFHNTELCNGDIVAYQSLRLLQMERKEQYDNIPQEILERWAGVVIAYSVWGEWSSLEYHQELVGKVYRANPQKAFYLFMKFFIAIWKGAENIDALDPINKFDLCWDKNIEKVFWKKLKQPLTPLKKIPFLLNKLIKFDIPEAGKYAVQLLGNSDMERSIIAAKELIYNRVEDFWYLIWEKINGDMEFGKQLMLELATSARYGTTVFTLRLGEQELASLFVWLAKSFPYNEDPHHDGVFSPGPRDNIKHLRDGVLDILVSRGTDQSCVALSQIHKEIPELEWIGVYCEKAERTRIQATWTYPNATVILDLINKKETRYVQSSTQLLDVVIEALRRIQQRMQGENPLAPFLWDYATKKPRSENDFSDFMVQMLRYELENRNIIIQREVEIRSNRTGQEGERTDIYINAVSDSGNIISVIVEAKGCWHPELLSAMETQLVNRYLRDNIKSGLYLIGWFNCPQWDQVDYRKREAMKHAFGAISSTLDSQAISLSGDGLVVKSFIIDVSLRH